MKFASVFGATLGAVLLTAAQGLSLNSVNATATQERSSRAGNTSKKIELELPSPDGFRNSKVWGPPLWFFLHSMTLALPDPVPPEQQAQVKSFVLSLREVLPCHTCAHHWRQQLEEDPIEPHLSNRTALVDWMIGMHNQVNKRNGHRIFTREEALVEFQLAYDKFGRWGGFQSVIGEEEPRKSSAGAMSFGSALLAVLLAASW
ncbi:ERV2 [Symbiodinium microadriaticum]|nr:ERV2 [Symbiodinium microadriaticum]